MRFGHAIVITTLVTTGALAQAQAPVPEVKLPPSPRGTAAIQVGGSWTGTADDRRYTGGSWITVDDASSGGSDPGPIEPDSAPDVGPQPLVECGDAGGTDSSKPLDASADALDECSPAPARCVDSRWLVFFEHGRCVDGRCVWDERFFRCRLECRKTGCFENITAAAPP